MSVMEALRQCRDIMAKGGVPLSEWHAALAAADAVLAQPTTCPACEGNPAPSNNPCAVCGAVLAQPKPIEPSGVFHSTTTGLRCDNCGEHLSAHLNGIYCCTVAQPDKDYPCRTDGRCQYAIDHGAEGLGHCPRGKCAMPDALAQPAPEPVAWMCEFIEEDGSTRRQFVEQNPEGLRWNDAGVPSPFMTSPLYTRPATVTLPPLPEWSKRDDLGGLVPSEIRSAMRDYARAALRAAGVEVT